MKERQLQGYELSKTTKNDYGKSRKNFQKSCKGLQTFSVKGYELPNYEERLRRNFRKNYKCVQTFSVKGYSNDHTNCMFIFWKTRDYQRSDKGKCNMKKLKQPSNSQLQWITRTLKKFRRTPRYYRQYVPRCSDRIRALNERIRSNGRKRRKLSRKSKMHTMTTKYWFYTTWEANMASCRRLRLSDRRRNQPERQNWETTSFVLFKKMIAGGDELLHAR